MDSFISLEPFMSLWGSLPAPQSKACVCASSLRPSRGACLCVHREMSTKPVVLQVCVFPCVHVHVHRDLHSQKYMHVLARVCEKEQRPLYLLKSLGPQSFLSVAPLCVTVRNTQIPVSKRRTITPCVSFSTSSASSQSLKSGATFTLS